MSSKKTRAFARVRAITFALSAVSFVAVLVAPLSALAAAPTISRTPPASVTVGSYYNFQPAAYDPDGDRLTFSIQNKPSWLVFYPDTGRIGRTATAANIGTYSNIVIRVTDGVSTASLPAFSIKVSAATTKRAPTISRTPPASVTVGSYYNFQPAAYDPDGNPLTFSIQNKPSWLVFYPDTGRLGRTATAANIGTYSNIIISVSDGLATASLPAFSITVSASGGTTNQPPTISGTPPTSVRTGVAYSFTPTARDPEGKTLTFSIANKPAWAAFSTTTGRLSGTPSSTQTGTFSSIRISVSDGTTTVSLPTFAIVVSTTSTTGSATLSWTPPTLNTNGTALTNLAGYRILYGTSATSLTRTIQVANAGISRYVVENLASGRWYFSVRAYTTTGVESAASATANTTVP
jgi:hypothetical protein